MIRRWCSLLLMILGLAGVTSAQTPQAPGHWPRWRGPNRDGIAPETGLLTEWPEGGPPLLWKRTGIGTGFSPVSVAAGRIVSVGYREEKEYLFALDGDGKELWATPMGPVREAPGMQWLSQRQPTVDGDRVYAVTNVGELICVESASGKPLWQKNFRSDFQGVPSPWGYCDYPLVDGDRLICCPGGKIAAVVALDRKTGKVVWRCPFPESERAEHSALVLTEARGVRQYVKCFSKGLAGISTEGKLLWHYAEVANATVNAPPPVTWGDHVFAPGSYGKKSVLLELRHANGAFEPNVVYNHDSTGPWTGHVIRLGDLLLLRDSSKLACLELKTGKLLWQEAMSVPSMIFAEDRLYARYDNGEVKLLQASRSGLTGKGTFKVPTRMVATMPAISGGRLYLRDQDTLYCHDIEAPKQRSRGPRPPFVPTPQDVVDKMLELAKVKKTDTIVDLGCGDGRIVVTAAQKYGCRAIGYDLDRECLHRAMASVKQQQLEERVQIVEEDIFSVDVSKIDVVTLYLWPSTNVKLIPQFEKMKPGAARIVSHAADMKGVVPDKVIIVKSKDDEQERKLYLWTLPLKKEPLSK